ncbi:hypothetical protein [Lacrimispora sp.]|uniref:hypothetical protein n=1 Tax=Lacrimispora sp. TaxID=2719234 RepID=UPI0028AA8436|nr:hypothetical protein [Lacrimispora sp.]
MYAIIHNIEPFDSSDGTEIKFTWQGNQIYKVRCIIKDNTSGEIKYDQIVESMKQSFIVPINSGLINGGYYIAYITVFDVNNSESSVQGIGTPFYCLSSPAFKITVENSDILKSSTCKIGLNYYQTENESLNSFLITLYTYQKTELQSSGNIYDTTDMSYTITGLENAKQYYIRATGKTLHNMNLDTGYILLTVSYQIAQIFSPLELNNKSDYGSIEIKSNIVSTVGMPDKDVIFIDNKYVDLRDNKVTYDVGFKTEGDFTKVFVFYEPKQNNRIIHLEDGKNFTVDIYYRKGSFSDSSGEKGVFELVANSCGIKYILFSNYIEIPTETQQFALCVNRIGSYYDLRVIHVNKK